MSHVWTPDDINFIIDGQPVTGFGPADLITFTPDGPGNTISIGTNGEECFNVSKVKSGVVEFNLMQSAAFNTILSGMFNADAQFAIAISDSGGDTAIAGASVMIANFPQWKAGPEVDVNVWKLIVAKVIANIGGKTN